MKLLALSDTYIPAAFMRHGLQQLESRGLDIEIRSWEHDDLVQLQQANLAIEQGGPAAIALPEEITSDLDDVEILVTQFAPVARQLIDSAGSLRLVAVLRGGTENVDVDAATRRGIAVMNTPGRNARAVAECTIGLILTEIRNLARSHARLSRGQWQRESPNGIDIPELNGKTVGLVGYGAVGRLVAHFLQAFGSRIVACDPYCKSDPSPAELTDLTTLLTTADIVSLHARLSDETRHLIGRNELAQMKNTAVLINTARSDLIDEPALVEALQQRRIMGAALDVFDIEPLPDDHPLLTLDNVTLTPHLAGSTIDAFRNSPKLMADHLVRMLDGQQDVPIINGITPQLSR